MEGTQYITLYNVHEYFRLNMILKQISRAKKIIYIFFKFLKLILKIELIYSQKKNKCAKFSNWKLKFNYIKYVNMSTKQ